MTRIILFIPIFLCLALFSCEAKKTVQKNAGSLHSKKSNLSNTKMDTATFGAGCFWCVEAVFQNLKGVESVQSGYSGGKIKDPTYREISSGKTGHAEVIQLVFDTEIISFDELLEVFWQTHDPTTLNRQGADVGTQYRSVIFYHNEEQKNKAESYKKQLNQSETFPKPIVTEITEFQNFYIAEDFHHNYYNENKEAPYCTYVIKPKLDKLKKVFQDKLKK